MKGICNFFFVKKIANYFLKNNALTCTPTHSMRLLASTHPGQHWGLANAKSMQLITWKVTSHFYYEGYNHSICLFFMFVCHSHLFFYEIPVYSLCPLLYFLKYFFWCGLFFKVFVGYVHNITFVLCFVFWQEARGILAPQPEMEPAPPALGKVPTTGPPGKSPSSLFFLKKVFLFLFVS